MVVCYRTNEYENKINRIVNALKERIAAGKEIVVKATGDRLGIMYNESEGGYMVYYYGNVYTKTDDCDLMGVWPTLESFAKSLM